MTFDDFYPAGHQSGVSIIMHGKRIATGGDVRLEQTAQYAAEHGFASFTTTLLVSPFQNHTAIIQAAEKASEKYGIPFLYRDFRPGFQDGQAKARELELYMQKYCGCIFSEEERYRRKQMQKEKQV